MFFWDIINGKTNIWRKSCRKKILYQNLRARCKCLMQCYPMQCDPLVCVFQQLFSYCGNCWEIFWNFHIDLKTRPIGITCLMRLRANVHFLIFPRIYNWKNKLKMIPVRYIKYWKKLLKFWYFYVESFRSLSYNKFIWKNMRILFFFFNINI